MSQDKKKTITTEETKKKNEIPEDQLADVTGGGVFDNVPRVPENPIDDNLKENI